VSVEVNMCELARFWIVRVFAVAVFCVYLSAGQFVQAGQMFAVTITASPSMAKGGPNPNDVSAVYNGQWVFDVSADTTSNPATVSLTVVSANNDINKKYVGVTYTFNATMSKDDADAYNFSGTSLGTRAPKPPPGSDFNLGIAGTYNALSESLTIPKAVTSQRDVKGVLSGPVYYFNFANIKAVPEPSSSVLGLIALAIVGPVLTSKRQRKQSR
jgi:hypothetical protein